MLHSEHNLTYHLYISDWHSCNWRLYHSDYPHQGAYVFTCVCLSV